MQHPSAVCTALPLLLYNVFRFRSSIDVFLLARISFLGLLHRSPSTSSICSSVMHRRFYADDLWHIQTAAQSFLYDLFHPFERSLNNPSP